MSLKEGTACRVRASTAPDDVVLSKEPPCSGRPRRGYAERSRRTTDEQRAGAELVMLVDEMRLEARKDRVPHLVAGEQGARVVHRGAVHARRRAVEHRVRDARRAGLELV